MLIRGFTLILLWLFFLLSPQLLSCTTAIISGKYTVDGRPLLLKHRDSDFEQNKIMYFNDGKYDYIGLVNSVDSLGHEVWAGFNSAGFAIMNAASYNLKYNDTTALADREGVLMKKALQICASVEEFAEFLRNYPKPMGVEANFGVIDAAGGAAYFETDNFNFTRTDAGDAQIAPFGYIIRTNYSFSGRIDDGYGYIRYQTAQELFYQAAATNDLSVNFILKDVCRSLRHSLTGTNLADQLPASSADDKFVCLQDYIVRNSSTTSMVIRGVKQGEPAQFTTMYTILGFPLCSVAIPLWITGDQQLPEIVVANQDNVAPLCNWSLILKKKCFPVSRGSGYRYLNLSSLSNRQGTGILQKLLPLEDKILKATETNLSAWRRNGLKTKELGKFYRWLDNTTTEQYKNILEF